MTFSPENLTREDGYVIVAMLKVAAMALVILIAVFGWATIAILLAAAAGFTSGVLAGPHLTRHVAPVDPQPTSTKEN